MSRVALLWIVLTAALQCTIAQNVAAERLRIRYKPVEWISPASGAEMFKSYCAPCHGVDGHGGGPAAVALKTPAPDLTTLSIQNHWRFPEARVHMLVAGTSAGAARPMPVWSNVFQSIDPSSNVVRMRISSIVSYLQSIQQK
jgi:mono/diheme cytochrome c family protein